MPEAWRIGQGYDVHRLAEGRRLVLGGVCVDHPSGLLGHSDGDVLLHAVIDALLGAAGLGDIGEHFPDTDPAYKDANSAVMLRAAVEELRSRGWRPAQVDCTLHAEQPRLGPLKAKIRRSVAELLCLPVDDVNIKAKTAEGLGEVGRGEAIAAQVVAVIEHVRAE